MSRISSFYMLGYIIFEQDSPGGSERKESAYIAGDPGSIPGLGRFPREGNEWQPPPVFLPGEFHG